MLTVKIIHFLDGFVKPFSKDFEIERNFWQNNEFVFSARYPIGHFYKSGRLTLAMLFSYGKQRAPSEIGHKKRFAYFSCKKERFVLNYPYITFVRTRENCALVLNEER